MSSINPTAGNNLPDPSSNSALLAAIHSDPNAATALQSASLAPAANLTNETTIGSLGGSNTLNVSSGSINPSANQQSIQLAQNSPRQQTQNGLDRANGFAGGVDLVNNALTRRAIYNDARMPERVSPAPQQRHPQAASIRLAAQIKTQHTPGFQRIVPPIWLPTLNT
jgi:hypothetical protein